MRVDEDSGDEEAVEHGVKGAGGEGSDGQRDQAGGNQALEAPVVAAVGVGCIGDGGGVVD